MKFIMITGLAGSGKTTHAEKLAAVTALPLIKPGTLARERWKDKKWGLYLAPEQEMRKMVMREIDKHQGDIILDGFPRNISQYEWLQRVYPYTSIQIIDIKPGFFTALGRFITRDRKNDTFLKFFTDAYRYYSLKFFIWISK